VLCLLDVAYLRSVQLHLTDRPTWWNGLTAIRIGELPDARLTARGLTTTAACCARHLPARVNNSTRVSCQSTAAS
jgi:hypothetical protein